MTFLRLNNRRKFFFRRFWSNIFILNKDFIPGVTLAIGLPVDLVFRMTGLLVDGVVSGGGGFPGNEGGGLDSGVTPVSLK